jgi:RNA polymerase sigma factor (sigma-70 family)
MNTALLLQTFEDNRAEFRKVAYIIYPDASEVDDILQDTFISVFRRLSRGEHPQVYALLKRSVVNTAITYLRKSRSADKLFSPLGPHDTSRASTISPEKRLLLQDRALLYPRVRRLVKRLSPREREAIEVYFLRGERRRGSLQDYCSEKGIPYSTFRSRMLSGLSHLKAKL